MKYLINMAAIAMFLTTACNTPVENESIETDQSSTSEQMHSWHQETTTYIEKAVLNASGDSIKYPEGQATISSKIVVWEPGFETGIHKHPVPIAVNVYQGELTVEFTESGTSLLTKAGESYVSAPGLWHKSSNKGEEELIFSLVYIGTDQVEHTVAQE